jgi:CHAD domain-containing protein/CYTH domain-containing protein
VTRQLLLDLPTADAIGRTATKHLADAEAALARLGNRQDTEALHDFRVAIRRVRSLLRAYGRWLGRAGGKKVRRRLRSLGRATNAGRDAEVQLTWLEGERSGLARGERAGLNWLTKRLRATRLQNYRTARRHVRQDFRRTRDLLVKRLGELDRSEPSFRETFTQLLRREAADLETRLAAIHDAAAEEEAHGARIAAKRLRYLLEPVTREVPGLRKPVARLKKLQDVLGELHDMHVLEGSLVEALEEVATEKARQLRTLALAGDTAALRRSRRRDERLGLATLAAKARAHRDALYGTLEREWLGDAGKGFFRDLQVQADTVGVTPTPPVERERKYLLTGLPDVVASVTPEEIEQGWLPGDRLRERVRRVTDADGDRFYRTVKLGAGVERIEIEEETTRAVFDQLWPLTEGCRIVKQRYRVPEGEFAWEVDAFRDRDLVLAEVELPADRDEAPIPDWLSPVVSRDVTGDPAYLNLTLATEPAGSPGDEAGGDGSTRGDGHARRATPKMRPQRRRPAPT